MSAVLEHATFLADELTEALRRVAGRDDPGLAALALDRLRRLEGVETRYPGTLERTSLSELVSRARIARELDDHALARHAAVGLEPERLASLARRVAAGDTARAIELARDALLVAGIAPDMPPALRERIEETVEACIAAIVAVPDAFVPAMELGEVRLTLEAPTDVVADLAEVLAEADATADNLALYASEPVPAAFDAKFHELLEEVRPPTVGEEVLERGKAGFKEFPAFDVALGGPVVTQNTAQINETQVKAREQTPATDSLPKATGRGPRPSRRVSVIDHRLAAYSELVLGPTTKGEYEVDVKWSGGARRAAVGVTLLGRRDRILLRWLSGDRLRLTNEGLPLGARWVRVPTAATNLTEAVEEAVEGEED